MKYGHPTSDTKTQRKEKKEHKMCGHRTGAAAINLTCQFVFGILNWHAMHYFFVQFLKDRSFFSVTHHKANPKNETNVSQSRNAINLSAKESLFSLVQK
jgi:hypothetical protein